MNGQDRKKLRKDHSWYRLWVSWQQLRNRLSFGIRNYSRVRSTICHAQPSTPVVRIVRVEFIWKGHFITPDTWFLPRHVSCITTCKFAVAFFFVAGCPKKYTVSKYSYYANAERIQLKVKKGFKHLCGWVKITTIDGKHHKYHPKKTFPRHHQKLR